MRILMRVCAVLFVISIFGGRCFAADTAFFDTQIENIYDAMPSSARAAVDNEKKPEFADALGRIAEIALETLKNNIKTAAYAAGAVIVICALCAAAQTFSESSAGIVRLAGIAAIASVFFSRIRGVLSFSMETMETLFAFGKTLLPALCAAQVMTGAVSAAGSIYTCVLFAGDILLTVTTRIMTPLVYAYCLLVTASGVSGNDGLEKLAKLVKGATVWVLKFIIGIFTTYLIVSGALMGRTGMAAVKTLKFASSAVPLIGGVLSDAAETVAAGARAAQGVIGAAGLAGILAIIVTPFVKTALFCALFRLASALSAMTGANQLASYAQLLCDGFSITLAICAACTLIIVIGVFAVIMGASFI